MATASSTFLRAHVVVVEEDDPQQTQTATKQMKKQGQELTRLPQRRRSQVAFVREQNEVCAMNGIKRMKAKAFNVLRRLFGYLFGCFRGGSFYKSNQINFQGRRRSSIIQGIQQQQQEEEKEKRDADDDDDDAELGNPPTQYRLEARIERKIQWKKRILSVITCCYIGASSEFGLSSGHTHRWMSSWMHWIFRVNLIFAFFCMCIMYFAIALVFSGLIVAAGVLNPECVRVGGLEFGTLSSRFFDAFCLSWTTFATVGYGSVYPASSNQTDDRSNCAFIAAIASFETFMGILYSGFCGAVLFAKVLNLRNVAMIAFSDPFVIRYGCGVEDHLSVLKHEHIMDLTKHRKRKQNDHKDDDKVEGKRVVSCPVLEFRVANLVWDKPNGVYIDAQLNVVADVDAKDVDPSLRDALDPETRWKRAISSALHTIKRNTNRSSQSETSGTVDTASESTDHAATSSIASDTVSQQNESDYRQQSSLDSSSSQPSEFYDMYASVHGGSNGHDNYDEHDYHDQPHHQWKRPRFRRLFHRHSSPDYSDNDHSNHHHFHHDHLAIDDDATSTLVTKRILSKMHLESTDHPYFKRVWLARHILDEHSPLLTAKVKRLIRRNHGNWPEELNSFTGVRDSLKFNQIIVSFQGVCNATATTVYAQKIYHRHDCNVGYQFVDMLWLDDEENLAVNVDKINHVREQNGGGGEPLMLHSRA